MNLDEKLKTVREWLTEEDNTGIIFSLSKLKTSIKEELNRLTNCKHLNSRMNSGGVLGYATCPDCGKEVFITEIINNLLDAMRDKTI